ncbi:MAG: hypothetical protein ABIR06_14295 [Cyclobacteriaceae bacterium]
MYYNIHRIFLKTHQYLNLHIWKVTKVFNYQAAPEEASNILKGKPPAGSISLPQKFRLRKINLVRCVEKFQPVEIPQ